MNAALWNKAGRDCWLQLLVSVLLLAAFAWLFVWLMSLFKPGFLVALLDFAPDFAKDLIGISPKLLGKLSGRISVLYVHVIPLLIFIGWAVGRGSDAVSGGISSGRLELILTLPLRRVTVLIVPAVVSTVGAAVLAAALWAGMWLGLKTVDLDGEVAASEFLPGVLNLFAMTVCLSGATAFLSSWDRDRWRTIWLAGGFFVASAIIKMVARLWTPGAWLRYFSFLTAFEPQQLILQPEETCSLPLSGDGGLTLPLWLGYDLTLILLGLIGYAVAAVIFTRRDIPVPR